MNSRKCHKDLEYCTEYNPPELSLSCPLPYVNPVHLNCRYELLRMQRDGLNGSFQLRVLDSCCLSALWAAEEA